MLPDASVTSLNCAGAVNSGGLNQGIPALGVTGSLPYTGGNGGGYIAQSIPSTGVSGLTANLAAGTLASGSGNLSFTFTGTPGGNGNANFAISLGGQSCTLSLPVWTASGTQYSTGTVFCAASGPTAIVNVTNPTTGKIWMDRNLGAAQAATSSTDANAYGDLYQWGRGADGHQCRNSMMTNLSSSSDQPGHGNFVIVSGNWRSPQNSNLWQGANGVNNPCPAGYRVPSSAELEAERLSWSSQNAAGAFASPLKLPLGGLRSYNTGVIGSAGSGGYYYSSTFSGSSGGMEFANFYASLNNNYVPALGYSVRCIKE